MSRKCLLDCSANGAKWADDAHQPTTLALPAQQHPTAPLPPLHRMGLLHCIGITYPDRQDP